MIIYKTTNLINGKFYIGKDSYNNPNYYGSGILIKRAIQKYGKENFKKEIIDMAETLDELNEKEIYWIEKTNAIHDGYNIQKGGDGQYVGWFNEHPNREEIRKKMSVSSKINIAKRSDELKQKFAHSRKGKKYGPRSEETKKKLSEWRTGKTIDEIMDKETADKERERMRKHWKENNPNNYIDNSGENNPMFGKTHKPESIEKMRKAAKGRPSPTKGKFKKFLFYKNDELIYEALGQQAAIKYCKENKLPYGVLVKRFKEWNNYKCITKKN